MDPLLAASGPAGALLTKAFIVGGLAAAIAASAKIICMFFVRHKYRKVTIEMDNRKIIVEGHPIEEENILLERMFTKEVNEVE